MFYFIMTGCRVVLCVVSIRLAWKYLLWWSSRRDASRVAALIVSSVALLSVRYPDLVRSFGITNLGGRSRERFYVVILFFAGIVIQNYPPCMWTSGQREQLDVYVKLLDLCYVVEKVNLMLDVITCVLKCVVLGERRIL